jgi:hypothetical protein
LLLFALACHPAAPSTPVETYLTFLKDLRDGDANAAYQLLSQPTQKALQARADAVNAAGGDKEKANPAGMIFHRPPPAPTDVRAVKQTADQAVLKVKGEGVDGQVQLVHEASGWRIDLTSTLKG